MTYIKASLVAQRLGVKNKTLTEWRSQGSKGCKMAAAGSVDRAHRPPRLDLIGGHMASEILPQPTWELPRQDRDGKGWEWQPGYVYFIQAGEFGPIKIGFARDPTSRILSIAANNHEDLSILGVIKSHMGAEKALHRLFATIRTKREWFSPTAELLAWIKTNAEFWPWRLEWFVDHRRIPCQRAVRIAGRAARRQPRGSMPGSIGGCPGEAFEYVIVRPGTSLPTDFEWASEPDIYGTRRARRPVDPVPLLGEITRRAPMGASREDWMVSE